MSINFIPLDRYTTKLYQYENSFKGFSGISEEQLIDLTKKVYKNEELMAVTSPKRSAKLSKLDIYSKTLQYLTNPSIVFDLKTYDERIAYLILMADPNLVTFKEFLKLNLISKDEIASAKEAKKRKQLNEMRIKTLA